MSLRKSSPAILLLKDGGLFRGVSIGAEGIEVAEVVFNTSMTGYQEILTDPSYLKQFVALTHPHVGNTGVNSEDVESGRVMAAGLLIRDLPLIHSNFRAERSLSDYLKDEGVVGVAGIDTRRLAGVLRRRGAQPGLVAAGSAVPDLSDKDAMLELKSRIDAFGTMAGKDLAKEISCSEPYRWTGGLWKPGGGFRDDCPEEFKVVAYDFGIKRNILRMLRSRGCAITVVPATTPASEVLAMKPDGVFLSNGPGDPEPCGYAIEAVRRFISEGVPLFGICLGHQLLGLALGGRTRKMKFGHHGANHPVRNLDTGEVLITSQNHGFEVDASSLPANARVTHVSLFDGSVQGIEIVGAPAFSFQGHPEASPGPHDAGSLFDRFVDDMRGAKVSGRASPTASGS